MLRVLHKPAKRKRVDKNSGSSVYQSVDKELAVHGGRDEFLFRAGVDRASFFSAVSLRTVPA